MDNVQHVLTSNRVVLEEIMSYLPILDLYRFQRVCKAWRVCAKNRIEMRKRCPNTQLLTLVQGNSEGKFVTFGRATKDLKWKKNSEKYKQLLQWQSDWTSLPRAGICVCLAKHKKKSTNFNAENILRYWLPPKSEILVLSSVESIVSADPEYSSKENLVEEAAEYYNFLSFPSKPGSYSVEFLNLHSGHVDNDHDKFIIDAKRVLDNPDTKLLLVCEEVLRNRIHPILHNNILGPAVKNGKVVIGCMFQGPIVFSANRSYADSKDNNSTQNVMLMSIIGKKVRAASVLIGGSIDTVADFQTHLQKLKTTVEQFSQNCPERCVNRTANGCCYACSSQTIGIMVACCARADAVEWYEDDNSENAEELSRNFEQQTFRSMMPNIPLLGMYGLGELGASINLIGENSDACTDSDGLLKGESTVFAVVMLK